MDKYDKVSKNVDDTYIVPDGYAPSEKERKKLKFQHKMFQASSKARSHKVKRWRRNEELYNGDFFKPFKLPKYKSRIVANIVHSTVETIYSILTDRFPKVDFMPKTEEQITSAIVSQEVVESVLEKGKCNRAIRSMKKDGIVYGNGFLKLHIDQENNVDFTVPDIYQVFVDPLATSIENAKCVTFAVPTYLKDIRANYDKGKFVKAEGKLDEYRSFIKNKEDDDSPSQVSTVTGGESPPNKTTDYMEKSPIVDEWEDDYGGGMALLRETWYWEGDKLMLCTWTDKVLLQLTESPYPFIPVVMFKNYADEHHFWGKGEPEVIEPLAVGTSILLSQGVDNLIYHGNPAWVMTKNVVKNPQMRPTDKPGQVFYVDNPSQSVQRLPAGNISSSTLPVAESLLKMADQVSGVHDITQGRNPSGVTSGRAIGQLQEASQQIIRTKEREVGSDTIVSLFKYALHMLKYNYNKVIKVRKESQSGKGYEFFSVAPHELDSDLDYKYIPGSSMPESRASRFDQALDLVQLGLLDQKQFWMWTQKDVSKDILESMLQQEKAREDEIQRLVQIIETSTDEQEIQQAQLMLRELMTGQDQQSNNPQEEEGESNGGRKVTRNVTPR